MNKVWYLSQINLLEELPMEDLQMIDAMAPMSRVPKGTLIITPDTENVSLYFLKQGRVRLFKVNEDGKQLTIGLLGKGNIFGETETFSTGSGSAYVEAMDDALVCILGKKDFEGLLMKRPQVALKMVSILTQRIRESEEMLENLAFRDVRYRLLYLLSKLAKSFGQPSDGEKSPYTKLDLNLSHQELANMIGATRESVSVTLSQLAKEGIVTTGRKEIAVDLRKAGEIIEER
ncbi:Crp/Fnr family transcriptional regulator [Alicyclobacillus ferrooxydans]|uniref:cAMP-binding protein n=1 Tax=Alicyclobacillus ferrooxydans TaxID=471514 RepID=A0A0P9CHU6_9BACL|nr:Crp/Fnr family transcriptional regulator [Alicyclobacillus ferrooxydans]KPV45054.1 hypothetical protein AN477_04100 [Alicyclobacillus ferrooxydans]